MIAAATGVNLWAEWVSIELANLRGQDYQLPEHKREYAGILICLARQSYPDLSAYNEPEVVWRLDKENHAGLIVASPDHNRVDALLDDYAPRFAADFLAVAPPLDEPPN